MRAGINARLDPDAGREWRVKWYTRLPDNREVRAHLALLVNLDADAETRQQAR